MRNYHNPGRSDEPGLAYDFTDTLILDPAAEAPALGAVLLARALRAVLVARAGGTRPLIIYRLDDVLSIVEAASFLGVDRSFVAKLVEAGDLPGEGLGMGLRIPLADLAAYRVERDRARHEALAELVSISEAAGAYDEIAGRR